MTYFFFLLCSFFTPTGDREPVQQIEFNQIYNVNGEHDFEGSFAIGSDYIEMTVEQITHCFQITQKVTKQDGVYYFTDRMINAEDGRQMMVVFSVQGDKMVEYRYYGLSNHRTPQKGQYRIQHNYERVAEYFSEKKLQK